MKSQTVTYHGKNSTMYSGSAKPTGIFEEQSLPNNDFKSANYALMIFDKSKQAFRLVPIQNHI